MDVDALLQVQQALDETADDCWHAASEHTSALSRAGQIDQDETDRRRLLLSTLPPSWIRHTPLGRHIRHLLEQRTATDPTTLATAPDSVTAVDHDATGRWLIRTATSSYDIDLDQNLMRRYPGDHLLVEDHEDGRLYIAYSFDSDGSAQPFLSLIQCHVGLPLLLTDGPGYDRRHLLRSTPIRHIKPARTDDTSS